MPPTEVIYFRIKGDAEGGKKGKNIQEFARKCWMTPRMNITSTYIPKLDVQRLTCVTERWVVCQHGGRHYGIQAHTMPNAMAPLQLASERFHLLHYTASNGRTTDKRRVREDWEGNTGVPIKLLSQQVRIAGAAAVIRTEFIPNTILERY